MNLSIKKTTVFLILLLAILAPISVKADKEYCWEKSKDDCIKSRDCVYNEEYGFCNINDLTYVQCGNSYDIPSQVPYIFSIGVTILKTVTPIILVVMAILTLLKATASNEDEMNKAKKKLITKIIAGVMAFLVISLVQFVILKVAEDDEKSSITSCLSCFLNNSCEGVTYFEDGYGNCFGVDGSNFDCPDK